MEDNRTLITEHTNYFFVIVVKRDSVEKYISKNYYHKNDNYTIKLNRAMKFNNYDYAENFSEEIDNFIRIDEVEYRLKISRKRIIRI